MWNDLPVLSPTARKLVKLELIAFALMTLGRSGVYAALRLLDYATRPDVGVSNVSSQTVSMTGVYSDRVWLDLLYQAAALTFALVPILLAALLLLHGGLSLRSLWLNNERAATVRNVVRGAALAASVGGVGIAFYFLAREAGWAVTLTAGNETWTTYVLVIVDAVKAALSEELLLLGYFIPRFLQLGLKPRWALVLAALLRGSYHLYQGLWGMVGNFVMGLVFGHLYLRWRTVAPMVFAHFLMDLVAFAGLALLFG